jgi:hypothetical protein
MAAQQEEQKAATIAIVTIKPLRYKDCTAMAPLFNL